MMHQPGFVEEQRDKGQRNRYSRRMGSLPEGSGTICACDALSTYADWLTGASRRHHRPRISAPERGLDAIHRRHRKAAGPAPGDRTEGRLAASWGAAQDDTRATGSAAGP
jgi:hypothetical protein